MAKGAAGLSPYVSALAAAWDREAPGVRWRRVDASLCLVDVSGFTTLTERLARRGRVGAEELTNVLNDVFGTMIRLAEGRGGDVLSFGGDALLLLFTGPDHAERAVAAALAMRSSLRMTARRSTSAGLVDLRASMGVHSGPVDIFRVASTHRELIVAGPAATAVTSLEKDAEAGEILVSEATRNLLPESWTRPRRTSWAVVRRGELPLDGYEPPLRPALSSTDVRCRRTASSCPWRPFRWATAPASCSNAACSSRSAGSGVSRRATSPSRAAASAASAAWRSSRSSCSAAAAT